MAKYKKDLSTFKGRLEYSYRQSKGWGFYGSGLTIILSVPLVLVYIFLVFKIQYLGLCSGINSCQVWGDNLTKSLLLGIFALFLFSTLVDYFLETKFNLIGWRSTSRKLFPFGIFVLLLGLLIFLNVYVKTTTQYLEIGDINHPGLFSSYKIPFDQISGVGITSIGSPTSRWNHCRILPYVILKDNENIPLYGALSDFELIRFLRSEKHIPSVPDINRKC
jgi:hypothetical protein